jgi:hypothetical protein
VPVEGCKQAERIESRPVLSHELPRVPPQRAGGPRVAREKASRSSSGDPRPNELGQRLDTGRDDALLPSGDD